MVSVGFRLFQVVSRRFRSFLVLVIVSTFLYLAKKLILAKADRSHAEAATQKCSVKKLLKNFVIITGKHCWCLFFNKVAGLRSKKEFKKERL